MKFNLSINTGFAVNRYSCPSEYLKIIGDDCDVRNAQLTADLINPYLGCDIIEHEIDKILKYKSLYDVSISSTFTGAFTRLNHLAHPDEKIQKYWVNWFKKFAYISKKLGSNNFGSHFGILSFKDYNDENLKFERMKQNIKNWHLIAEYAKSIGIEYISWEPMSIGREYGETQEKTSQLHEMINKNSPLPFLLCLDVDHGDLESTNPIDNDPYSWLENFAEISPLIHLKQSCDSKSGHFPFTDEYNKIGKIVPNKVLDILKNKSDNYDLILELSFKERNPADKSVISSLVHSVNYWKNYL